MGISFKLDGICTLSCIYSLLSREKSHTEQYTTIKLWDKPWCFMTTINFTPPTKNHRWKPHSHKLIRSLFGKRQGGKGPADPSFFDVGAYWIFSWERSHIPKVCLKIIFPLEIIFPFPRWDILYSFVGGTKWPRRQKKSFDSWQAIGPTEFLPGSQLFTRLFSKARGVKMGLFAVGWPWWDCFYSQQLQICSCWFYSVKMVELTCCMVGFEIWESPRRTGWQIFCPPQRYYRLFGNSCISGDSRLISCNNE